MLTVGLTGGIGSGKSTVASLLAEHGAVIIDADALARDAIAPGTVGFQAVRDRFGDAVLTPDGVLDRAALASVVFADADARHDLEMIVHPEVRLQIAQVIADHAGTDDVVVLDSPLLVETGSDRDVAVVVVVSTEPPTQIERLVARGMDEGDARARSATQLPFESKAAVADVILDNDGSLDDLRSQVDRLWLQLMAMNP
ncbi:MAG TPA: dephospho-CoA kinase [Actinomycetota bacterium]